MSANQGGPSNGSSNDGEQDDGLPKVVTRHGGSARVTRDGDTVRVGPSKREQLRDRADQADQSADWSKAPAWAVALRERLDAVLMEAVES